MREIFEQIIRRLFSVEPHYVSNFDDYYEGLEFNPEPKVMIQIKFSLERREEEAGSDLSIEKHTMRFYPNKLESKRIYSGQIIRMSTGFPDYEVYEKILKNWRNF
jgi:hypothetical protein